MANNTWWVGAHGLTLLYCGQARDITKAESKAEEALEWLQKHEIIPPDGQIGDIYNSVDWAAYNCLHDDDKKSAVRYMMSISILSSFEFLNNVFCGGKGYMLLDPLSGMQLQPLAKHGPNPFFRTEAQARSYAQAMGLCRNREVVVVQYVSTCEKEE